MTKIKDILRNKWFKFTLVSIIYILLCVVWTGNLWMLLGLLVIFDIYISRLMYRFVGSKHRALKERSKGYRKTMEWVDAIVFAVVVVALLKLFVFGLYVIPTSSMEKSLLVGDYIFVSKLAYGPLVPNTPVSFPLVHNTMPFSNTKKSYSEVIKWPYHRLKGFGEVKRGDVVVFHYSGGDTVVLENPARTYYQYLRDYQSSFGRVEGRKRLHNDYTIVSHPVDKRENFVKRCVGVPGDSLRVVDSELLINGAPLEGIPRLAYRYYVFTNGTPINQEVMRKMGLSMDDIKYNSEMHVYTLPLTENNLGKIKGMSNVVRVIKDVNQDVNQDVFPHDPARYPWSEDNFGPIWIPEKGATVNLTIDNISLYSAIIENYELNHLEIKGEDIYINGAKADSYTFGMNYYFMMGDNRHYSLDSRFWGFVPEDHIVGKPSTIWLSFDSDKRFPFNIRWNRILRKIK